MKSRYLEFVELLNTQDRAREELLNDPHYDLIWVRSNTQTQGRGRQSRKWEEAWDPLQTPNLYLSAAIRCSALTNDPAFPWALLSLIAGHSLWQSLKKESLWSDDTFIKWPNDLYWKAPDGFKKLGGILAEKKGDLSVVGWGLNSFMKPEKLPQAGTLQNAVPHLNSHSFYKWIESLQKCFERNLQAWTLAPEENWKRIYADLQDKAMKLFWNREGYLPALNTRALSIALAPTGNLIIETINEKKKLEVSSGEWLFDPDTKSGT